MDICANSQMHARGGHGYDHLLRNFVPLLPGVSEPDIQMIFVDNSRRSAF
jgi:predicted metal-dependent phosphotriesterase family hydrolase